MPSQNCQIRLRRLVWDSCLTTEVQVTQTVGPVSARSALLADIEDEFGV